MSDPFDKRAKAFEDKQSYEAELHFKNKVEAVKRLCAWASDRLGFDEQTTKDYTKNLIDHHMITGGLISVIEAVTRDFKEYGFDEDQKTVEHKVKLYLAELDKEDGLHN